MAVVLMFDLLSPPAVHTGLLRLDHVLHPHSLIWLEPCLRPSPVRFLPASHLCTGPDPSSQRSAESPGSLHALHGQTTQNDPPRLGENSPHPLHPARG